MEHFGESLFRTISLAAFAVLVLGASLRCASAQEGEETQIRDCIGSAEGAQPATQRFDAHAAAARCASVGIDQCYENALKQWTYSSASAICYQKMFDIWNRLLAQAYESVLAARRQRWMRLADQFKNIGIASDPVLPAFVEAHEKWKAFVSAECAAEEAEVAGGTDAKFRAISCAVPITAERLFLYRKRLREEEVTIQLRTRQPR